MPAESSSDDATLPAPRAGDAPAAGPLTAIGPRIYGVIDVIRSERISGWAIDRNDSAAALEIEIHREGRLIASVRGDRHRADLEKGGVGTGRYGFAAEISPPIEPGFEFTVSATARAADGASVALKRAGTAAAAVDPEQRLLERLFEEVLRLGRTLAARPVPRGGKSSPDDAGPGVLIERLELVQARIEATLAAIEPPQPRPGDRSLRAIVIVTLAIALGSLGLGLFSFWRP